MTGSLSTRRSIVAGSWAEGDAKSVCGGFRQEPRIPQGDLRLSKVRASSHRSTATSTPALVLETRLRNAQVNVMRNQVGPFVHGLLYLFGLLPEEWDPFHRPSGFRIRWINWWRRGVRGYDVICTSCRRIRHVRRWTPEPVLFMCNCVPQGAMMALRGVREVKPQ